MKVLTQFFILSLMVLVVCWMQVTLGNIKAQKLRVLTLSTEKASKNFAWKELQCKGCENFYCANEKVPQKNIHPQSLEKLQALRDRVGIPLTINSAARCTTHNTAVGGRTNSYHLSTKDKMSRAFDIRVPEGMSSEEMIKHAKAVGFTGIGDYGFFVHIDDRATGEASWKSE
jgi:hypothetical protein